MHMIPGRAIHGLAIVATTLCLTATARAQFDAVTLADYSGAEIYQQFCASCHGESGRGDGPVAGSLAVAVPNLTTISRRHGGEFPTSQIRETIDGRGVVVTAHGTRVMPVWGYEFWVEEGADAVAEEEMHTTIDRLVEHIRSLQVDADRQAY